MNEFVESPWLFETLSRGPKVTPPSVDRAMMMSGFGPLLSSVSLHTTLSLPARSTTPDGANATFELCDTLTGTPEDLPLSRRVTAKIATFDPERSLLKIR